MAGLTPLTNCKCLELEILSSIRIMTKLAGMKDMAKMTQVATRTSALLLNLNQGEHHMQIIGRQSLGKTCFNFK